LDLNSRSGLVGMATGSGITGRMSLQILPENSGRGAKVGSNVIPTRALARRDLTSAHRAHAANGATPAMGPSFHSCVPRNHCPTCSNLPQQSECPRCVGKGALLSSRPRYPQTFCALHDRTPILHLLVSRLASREIRLMNLDHGLLKRAPQIFRGGRAVRLNMVCFHMVCFKTRHGALVCHFERTQLSCCTLGTVRRRLLRHHTV
jgi:hypothetical protein